MKPEQERLVTVLKDTISLLCKNSLSYEKQVVVQGLICVTVDKEDVLVVQVNDRFGEPNYDPCAACGHQKEKPPSAQQPSTSTPRPSENRKRPRSPDANRESSQPSPAKAARSTPRSQTSADSDSEGGDREESDAGGGGGGFELLPVKKEEMIEDDDDEDLVLIGEELGKHPTITGGGGYIDDSNSSSFQQQGQGGGDEPYITGFMQNTQIMPVAGGSQQQDSLDSSGAWDPNLSGSQGTEPSMCWRPDENGYYTCEICHAKMSTLGTLKRHVLAKHAQASHKCFFCQRSFNRNDSLRRHIAAKHRDLFSDGGPLDLPEQRNHTGLAENINQQNP